MQYSFEKFVESALPKVSIRKNGMFGFLGGAAKRFRLLENERVVICHYDRTAKVIGLQFTDNPDDEGAIKIGKTAVKDASGGEKVNVYFNGKPFLDFYEIPYNTARAFLSTWDEQNQMAIIDLSKEANDETDEG